MTALPDPNELAAELGADPKRVREFLRKNFPRPEHRWHYPWADDMTPAMVRAVRRHFA
jgi:hypothetical protein